METTNNTGVERDMGGDDELVPKRNAQSVIWRWFGFQITDHFKFQVLFVTYTTIQRLYNRQ